MEEQLPRIPVTIVTGFLGSGKTTFLNRILQENHGEKIAVIINEFGEVGIDNKLIIGSDEQIIEMNNGCLCCTVRGDLIEVLNKLTIGRQLGLEGAQYNFSRVLIETTGLAEPAPIIQTFLADPMIQNFYEIDAVVTLVDAFHLQKELDENHEAEEQIAFADVLVINKIDLVTEEERSVVEKKLRSLNPRAKIILSKHSNVSFKDVLGVRAFDIHSTLQINPDFLKEHVHHHDSEVKAIAFREKKSLDFDKAIYWIGTRIKQKGNDLMRYKGILNIQGEDKRIVFQGVYTFFETKSERLWEKNEERISEVVLIGRNLDRGFFEEGFKKCISTDIDV